MKTEVKVEDGYYVIRVPIADRYNDRLTHDFINALKVQEIVSRSQATEEQIAELAEEMTANWWAENKERFLSDISH